MHQLKDNDLILTSSGRIYHLDLLPEHLADTVITVGSPDRVMSVAHYFDSIEFKNSHREFVTVTGFYGKKRMSVLSTGIGTQIIDIFFNELDALVNIDFEQRTVRPNLKSLTIARIGTSGSISSEIPVGSFLLSKYAIDLTEVMAFYQSEANEQEAAMASALRAEINREFENIPVEVFAGSESLIASFMQTGAYLAGITATCDGFYAAQDRQLRAKMRHPGFIPALRRFQYQGLGVTNLEMETAALYGFSRILGHRCVSINAIVADRVNNRFCNDIRSLERRCIETSLEVLAKL